MQDLFYLRSSSNTSTYGTKSLTALEAQIWNSLPEHIKAETSFAYF